LVRGEIPNRFNLTGMPPADLRTTWYAWVAYLLSPVDMDSGDVDFAHN
jgi:hypothetical protein